MILNAGGGYDIATAGLQWNIACYADADDTAQVAIGGWTTAASSYIKIYTPTETTEVGATQRHDGTVSSGYEHNYSGSGVYGINVGEYYTRVIGLVVNGSSTASNSRGAVQFTSGAYYGLVEDCIIYDLDGFI